MAFNQGFIWDFRQEGTNSNCQIWGGQDHVIIIVFLVFYIRFVGEGILWYSSNYTNFWVWGAPPGIFMISETGFDGFWDHKRINATSCPLPPVIKSAFFRYFVKAYTSEIFYIGRTTIDIGQYSRFYARPAPNVLAVQRFHCGHKILVTSTCHVYLRYRKLMTNLEMALIIYQTWDKVWSNFQVLLGAEAHDSDYWSWHD